jgi:amidase
MRHLPWRFRPAPVRGAAAPRCAPICEEFRRLPDALERAVELDAIYGRNPDLEQMPMYGVVFSFKDPFDTKDMRTIVCAQDV